MPTQQHNESTNKPRKALSTMTCSDPFGSEWEKKFERDCARWKKRYGCTLGDAAGWCDGTNAKRCPNALNCKDGTIACELAL